MTDYTQPLPPAPAPAKKRRWPQIVLLATVALVSLLIGVGIGSAGSTTKTVTTAAAPLPAQTVTVFATATVQAAPAAKPTPTKAPVVKPVIQDGYEVVVGDDVPAGTYEARSTSDVCYWEIDKHGTSDIVDNDLGKLGHITVTLKKGEDFASHDCGDFTKK